MFGAEKEIGFESKAVALAQEFKLDANAICDAYRAKPESITAHFNSMSDAKENKGWYVGWGIFWSLACLPVAVYPAWKLFEKYRDLDAIEKSVRSEVESFKAHNEASPPAPARQ